MEYTLNKKNFLNNLLVLRELEKYAPSDDRLLAVPIHRNIGDPIFSFASKLIPNPNANNILIVMNLVSFLQSVNQVLSRVYAAHRWLIVNREKPQQSNLPQEQIDFSLHIENILIEEYRYSIRAFISMLRIAVDQFILLLKTGTLKYGKSCDCIGDFLGIINNDEFKLENQNRRFLIGLNAAANYLKHHPYQFENPSNEISLVTPCLLVIVNKFAKHKRINKDYQGLEQYFSTELQYMSESQIMWRISCDFLVKGFNIFYSWLKESSFCLA